LGIAAYGLWGLIPFYFRSLGDLPPLEVLAHRVIWSLVFLAALLTLGRRWPQVAQAVRSRRVLGALAASALLIGMNWFTYIGAVMNGQVLQASLGYFITPLVNVLLGVIFLGERLRPLQLAGVLLALAGVLNLALAGAGLPWISLTLAISFAFYGLLRKTTAINSTQACSSRRRSCLLWPPAGWAGCWLPARPPYRAILRAASRCWWPAAS
jgi:chloramphenicol-sensitive protein RarD